MRRALAVLFLAALPIPFALGMAAQDQPVADRVEEDWELVVAIPEPNLTGPQISTSMLPSSVDSSRDMVFNLNYRENPSFVPGGVQVQVRNGDNVIASSSLGTAQFQTQNETITWTQRMSLSDGNVQFKITAGNSTTWGEFGNAEVQLAVSAPTSVNSLAGYNPATSVTKSGVSFQSNLVTKMTLLRVRYYQGDTLLSTDETPRPVTLSK